MDNIYIVNENENMFTISRMSISWERMSNNVAKVPTIEANHDIAIIIPYYGLFVYDTQICDLQMEINQSSGDQSI